MKSNLNPLLEFNINPYKFGVTDAERTRFNPEGLRHNSTLDYADSGAALGGAIGLAGGAYLGNKTAKKIFRTEERKLVKIAIIESDSPEDCINRLKKLGFPMALSYCDAVQKEADKNPNGWKYKLMNLINLKNSGATLAGSLGGSIAGNLAGRTIGSNIGANIAGIPY